MENAEKEKEMGTEMVAFIEYDKYYEDGNATIIPAFSTDIYSLTMEEGLYTGSKDYLFFSAIAGVRNNSGISPLYSPRGLPSNLSVPLRLAVKNNVFDGLYNIGWLFLSEIHASISHMSINYEHLSFESHTILFIMNNLESRLGSNRVRFIFGFQ